MVRILLHQSDLSAWSRCPAQFGYRLAGMPDKTNSAAAYGSVMHHALNVMERKCAMNVSLEVATQSALETFVYYWNPQHISAVCDPVPSDGWLPKQSYSELRTRGINAIRSYANMMKRYDDHELLATEFEFLVDIDGTWDEELGRPHQLAGSIDRLAVRYYARNPCVCVDDYKTGKEQIHLRQNLQFTAYCYATTQLDFWTGTPNGAEGFGVERGTEMYERFIPYARRGTWINMRTFKLQDAGFRASQDYERFRLAVSQLALSIQADIFPLTINGEACTYCSFRDVCGSVGVPADSHGDPRV